MNYITSKNLIAAILCAALLITMTLPAAAGPTYSQQWEYTLQAELFNDSLNPSTNSLDGEYLTSYKEGWGYTGPYPWSYGPRSASSTETTYPYVGRSFKGTVTLNTDTTIADFVCIIVEKDCKLVVNEGVTLTMLGAIEVKPGGTLENNGTILMKPTADAGFLETTPDEKALLSNRGTFTNTGKLTLTGGSIDNEGPGILENNGTITLSNKGENSTGLSNSTLNDKGATITNNGTITVKNEGGKGIHNWSGSTIQNNGAITKTETATITGTIQGNPVTTASGN